MKPSVLLLTSICSALGYANFLDTRGETERNAPLAPRQSSAAATPTSSCTVSLVTPIPKYLRCEQTGIVAHPADLVPASTVPKSVATPFVACRNTCMANTKCVSFSYGAGSRSCHQYNKTLDGMAFRQTTAKGAVKVSNRHCYKQNCPSPSPSACTPTPTPMLSNPSFETVSADGSAPPWQTQGHVSFVKNSSVATDGSYYADITLPPNGTTPTLSQQLTGLTVGQSYILNLTYSVLQLPSGSDVYCLMKAVLNNDNFIEQYVNSGYPTSGNLVASLAAESSSDTFSFSLSCPQSASAEIAIDNVRLELPDPACLMTLQVVDPSNASGVDGYYVMNNGNSAGDEEIFFTANSTQATQYSVDPYSNVYWTSADPGMTGPYAYWADYTSVLPQNVGVYPITTESLTSLSYQLNQSPPDTALVTCTVDPATSLLSCTVYNQTVLSQDGEKLALGDEAQTESNKAFPIELRALYVTYK